MKTVYFVGNGPYADRCFLTAQNILSRDKDNFILQRTDKLLPEIKRSDAVLFVGKKASEIASFLGLYSKINVFSEYSVVTDVGREQTLLRKKEDEGREVSFWESYSELGTEKVARIAMEYAEKRKNGIIFSYSGRYEIKEFLHHIVYDVAQDYPSVFVDDLPTENVIYNISQGKYRGIIILTNQAQGDMISNVISERTKERGFCCLFGETVLSAYGIEDDRAEDDSFEGVVEMMLSESFDKNIDRFK